MGLVGKLEDLTLPEIFSLLSLSRKTGKLILHRREETAVVIFSDGQVVQAASSSPRESLGHLLLLQKVITENELKAALEIQKYLPRKKRLGTILVEKGFISQEVLENTIIKQIEEIIFEILDWKEGLFNFELGKTNIGDKIGISTHELFLHRGIKAEYLIMEGTRLADEKGRETPEMAEVAPTVPSKSENFAGFFKDIVLDNPEDDIVAPAELTDLRSMFMELRHRSLSGEITLLIMRYASETIDRGVLLMAKSDYICGLGQFGIESNGTSADNQVRNIRIPFKEPSIFSWSIEHTQAYKGTMPKNQWNDYLVNSIGGYYPKEVLIIPMMVEKKVVALIYGDNLLTGRPIKKEDTLEIFVNQAGVAMEKTLLEHRLQELREK
jgi:hypothetical protein